MRSPLQAAANEHHETEGREIALEDLEAQPISSIPPILEINGAEKYSVKEVMKIVSQLAQSVESHIQHSDTERTNLRTESRKSVSIVKTKMVINSTIVENVEDKIDHLTELLQKEAKEGTEEAAAQEDRKKRGKK